MHRVSIFSQNLHRHWRSTLAQTGTVGVFGTAHHIILAVLCGLVLLHLSFAVYCFYFDIQPLAIAKLVSAGFYIGCIKHKLKHYKSTDLLIALIVFEVGTHAMIANYYIGWHSGSSIYLMDVALVLAVITNTSLFSRLAAMLLLVTATIAADLYFADYVPVIQLSNEVLSLTRVINYTIALLLVAIAAMGYQYLMAIANTKIQRLANEDLLTGQMNRRAMIETSEALIAQCNAMRIPMCAAIGDLDHFKHINDTFGHAIGDEVLVAIAKTIRQTSLNGDLSGRWGGEEFVWLLPNTTPAQAQSRLNRFRVSVEALEPNDIQKAWHASISIGFTQVQVNEDFDKVISRADQALYTAKQLGRNRIEYQPIETSITAQTKLQQSQPSQISSEG